MTLDRTQLSPNARRWLDRCLPADLPLPNQVRNTQEGEMDIRGKWTPFSAETLYRIQPYAFVWKARFKMGPGLWIAAEDGHDGDSGWGGSKLWGLIPMGGRKGPEVFAMQLVRDLAELPWKPQFALVMPGLEWSDSGDSTFQVRARFGSQETTVSFELDAEGDVIRSSGKRYYDVPDGFVEAGWRYDFSDHQAFGGLRLPASATATYEKAGGPWQYWRGRITSVVPEPKV